MNERGCLLYGEWGSRQSIEGWL